MRPHREPGYARCTACGWRFDGPTEEVGAHVRQHWQETRDASLLPVYSAVGEAVYHGHAVHAFYGGEIPPDPRDKTLT